MSAIGDKLSFGLEWASSALIECTQPLTPGQFGRSSNPFYEVTTRLFFALVAVPVGIAGLLHRLATPVSKKDFEHLTGCPETPFPKNGKFIHLTLNACELGWGMSKLFGGISPWWENDRIKALANLILNKKADIVELQEMASPLASRELCRLLQGEYAHFYIDIGPHKKRYFNSGLFVATKFEVNNPRFIPFGNGQREINKGLFSFEVGECCQIIATHLEPGRGEKKARIRKEQLAIIEKEINPDLATLLAGDFNIETTDAEEFKFSESFGQVVHPDVITSTDYFQVLRRGQPELEKESGHTVDLAFARGLKLTCDVVETFTFDHPKNPAAPAPLSDHRGLLLTAELDSHKEL